MSYRFIEPLEEKPKVERKIFRKVSVAEEILNEFTGSKVKYAKVSFEKLKEDYRSPAFCARAIGRVAKRLKLDDRVATYSDENNVYLERLK